MVAATAGLIGKAGQVSLDLFRANGSLLTLGPLLFFPGSPVYCYRSQKSRLVVIKDVDLPPMIIPLLKLELLA